MSRRDSSIQNNLSAELSVCFLASSAVPSMSLVKGAMIPGNSAGTIHSVCSVPEVASMFVPVATAPANLGLRPSCLALLCLFYVSSSSGCSLGSACLSPFLRVTGKMSLAGWVLGATRSLSPYLPCLLFRSETGGRRFASHTTTPFGADRSMLVIACYCLLANL